MVPFVVGLANIEIIIAAGVEPVPLIKMVAMGLMMQAAIRPSAVNADLRGIGDSQLLGDMGARSSSSCPGPPLVHTHPRH